MRRPGVIQEMRLRDAHRGLFAGPQGTSRRDISKGHLEGTSRRDISKGHLEGTSRRDISKGHLEGTSDSFKIVARPKSIS
jgi:hypothetical protein